MVTPVLPNKENPQKFLKLDVKILPGTDRMVQSVLEQKAKIKSSLPTSQEDPLMFVERYLEKHVTPGRLQSNIKTNPLYSMTDTVNVVKVLPSWTIKDYTMHTGHGKVKYFLQNKEKKPRELDFWLEDLYTPGFDALLKKKEAEQRRKRLHRLLSVIGLFVSVVIVVIIVAVVVLEKKV
ncbi:major intrinsically disordered NOTCH2-binding receptor 1-like homolog [Hippocampus zosterae]|uniref:major intrinsically disordered NOTCH2-binding receptor 1-like homolog n=1 Tax=Hippocampus zosterae TaxID=109293 RepID=UPI00223DBDFE|nr:major intrinsically disordered NOTCH2-binding receptor 1-like homolog [Hippocampus zosterae]